MCCRRWIRAAFFKTRTDGRRVRDSFSSPAGSPGEAGARGRGHRRVSSPPHLGRRRSFHREFEWEMRIAQGRGVGAEGVRYGVTAAHHNIARPSCSRVRHRSSAWAEAYRQNRQDAGTRRRFTWGPPRLGQPEIQGSQQTLRWREMDSNFRFRARGAIDLSSRLSSMFLKLFVFCRTNIQSRPRWRLLSSCTRTPNGRLATGGGRDTLSAALTLRE